MKAFENEISKINRKHCSMLMRMLNSYGNMHIQIFGLKLDVFFVIHPSSHNHIQEKGKNCHIVMS